MRQDALLLWLLKRFVWNVVNHKLNQDQTEAELVENQHLRDVEDDVGVLVVLVGVDALSVVPEQISTGRAIVGESRDQMKRLTAAHPQRQVGRLNKQT